MTIHGEHPFSPAPGERDEARRFRGRLAAPVTIVTAGQEGELAGLTVSSLFLVEGEPPCLQMVVGPTSDLWYAIESTGRFVVHICPDSESARADVFAGLRPSPGGVFSGSTIEMSEWGPAISELGDRAYCTATKQEELGHSGVVAGAIDRLELTELEEPLVYFRGRYRGLG